MRFVFITISLWLSSSGIGQVSGWKEAKEALDSKKYQEAINLFKKIESNDGGGAGLYQNMALAAVGMQMYGDAVLYYEKALKYHPNDQQIKNDIKIIYERKNLLPPPGSSLFTTLPGLLVPHSWAWMGLVLLAMPATTSGASIHLSHGVEQKRRHCATDHAVCIIHCSRRATIQISISKQWHHHNITIYCTENGDQMKSALI
ncbi:MAG: tetratricopeptide repeat protein [Saprospiraceae bacterium]|nr:tetratricopeptide repeat protein [Saprospiraceae bacterium]